MDKAWVDILVKIAVEVVDIIANMLKDDKEGKKDDGNPTSMQCCGLGGRRSLMFA
jgi:hypothetical protein